jgi:hypothetical protein
MKLSAEGGQAKPVVANATGFNPWKFTILPKNDIFLDSLRAKPRFVVSFW